MKKKNTCKKELKQEDIKRAAVETELFLKLPADKQKQVIIFVKALLSGK